MKRTDGEFWKILTFSFLEGRPYTTEEVEQAAYVAIISATTRARLFGGQPAEGKTLVANGDQFRVIGVVEDVSTLRDVPAADIWVPYTASRARPPGRKLMAGAIGYKALALASSRDAFPRIRDEFKARVSRINVADYEEGRDGSLTRIRSGFDTKFATFARNFQPFTDSRDEPQTWRFLMLVGTLAFLFVLLPTVNLVNINVSRIMERASEIGIRKAFGASSRVLVGQFVVENVVLTFAGGVVGLVLSMLVLRAVTVSGIIRHAELSVNWRVFAYGLVMAVVFGVISGVYPAWRMSRLQAVDALRGGRR
jgi:putative ABC transport system permease protein